VKIFSGEPIKKESQMSTVFTKIANRELPANIVAEDSEFMAFLSNGPVKDGHTVVIAKSLETDRFFDLPEDVIARMMIFSKKLARSIEMAVACKRVAVMIIGLEVPHAHIHLIPVDSGSDVMAAKFLKLTDKDLEETARNIRACHAVIYRNTTV
jgi:histidine triad (HIT) family protein